jgi:hypothetical protein
MLGSIGHLRERCGKGSRGGRLQVHPQREFAGEISGFLDPKIEVNHRTAKVKLPNLAVNGIQFEDTARIATPFGNGGA